MADPGILGELHAALQVDRRAAPIRRIGEQPLLSAIDVHAVPREVNNQLIHTGTVDNRLDGVVDFVGPDLFPAGIGNQFCVRHIDHSLSNSPLMHPFGARCRVV
jgi:hypothetical protein